MPILYEGLDWEGEEPMATVRAVFRDSATNESLRLDLTQIYRLADGDREEVNGVEIDDSELHRAANQLRAVSRPT